MRIIIDRADVIDTATCQIDPNDCQVSGKVTTYYQNDKLLAEWFERERALFQRRLAALPPRAETAIGRFIRSQS